MSPWKNKRILVTGATGLVGSALCRTLINEGAYVVTLVRDWDPQSELIRSGTIKNTFVINGCLENYADVERSINEHAIDTIFHLGAQAIVGVANRSPLSTFESNVRGTYHLLEACRVHQKFVKGIVIASSDKAYGNAKTLPYSEEMPPLGRHPYDVSKSCADLISQSYYYSYKLPIIITRCGNIYGPGDSNDSRLIPGTIQALLNDKTPVIRSDGTQTRDYVYIDDAINAYMTMALSLERDEVKGEAFNFGPTQPLSVIQVVKEILKLMNKKDIVPLVLNKAQNEIPKQYLLSKKAERILGWKPKYTFEEGLKLTIDWYTKHLEKTPSTVGA